MHEVGISIGHLFGLFDFNFMGLSFLKSCKPIIVHLNVHILYTLKFNLDELV